jgi:hypothetical protein
MYTKDEVYLIWQDGKYLKKRGIEFHPFIDKTTMYTKAAEAQKPVIAYVYNIVKYEKQRINRFEFNLFLLRRYLHNEPRTPRAQMQHHYLIETDLHILEFYRPSVEFSSIKIVQPLDHQPHGGDIWPHLAADAVSRKPRVVLRPPFGIDFGGRLHESIPIEHTMTWIPVINAAYEAIAAEFFKDGVLA